MMQEVALGTLLDRLANGALYRPAPRDGVPITRIETIANGAIDYARTGRAMWEPGLSKYELRAGDILFSHINSVDHIGKVALVPPQSQPLYHGMNLLLLRTKSSHDSRYLYHWLNSEPTRRLMRTLARQAVSQASINTSDLRAVVLAVPSLEQQRAIADALSDVDALLDALDRLIAKKREVQNTTKRQLLAGETRLPGFKDQWEESSFANVVRHHAGNSTLIKGKLPSSEAAGLYPAYSASGQDVWCAHFEHEGNAVVVSAVGSRCGKAFAASGKWSAIANTHVVWPIRSKIDPDFLGFFINDEDFWLKSGTGQPFVLFSQTFARPLLLPPLKEQTAIARVLSDMEAELAGLEARRDKTHNIKKAMMQQLLTGKTRLVNGGARV